MFSITSIVPKTIIIPFPRLKTGNVDKHRYDVNNVTDIWSLLDEEWVTVAIL